MKFYVLYLLAIARGLWWRWPDFPPAPEGYGTVHVGLRNWSEARDMYERHGWIPWAVQRTAARGSRGNVARMFIFAEEDQDLG